MGDRRDPRLWRVVDGINERLCAGCQRWLPYDDTHFHYRKRALGTLQDQCKHCMCAYVSRYDAKQRSERNRTIERAAKLAATLPPLQALDAITAGWRHP